jgi:hypothetical protein
MAGMTSRPACALILILTGLGIGTGCDRKDAGGGGASSQASTAPGGGNGPYDVIQRAYAPYTEADDALGFPMKVRNLSAGPFRFWRGAKELFYEWARTNTADWLADKDAYVRIHGDLHPGNLGLYHSQGKFGRNVAFGAVDFDESAKLPFQVELLQGVVTFQLLANQRRVKMEGEQADQIIAAMLEAYRASLESTQTPTELLEEDRWVGKLLKDARKRDYEDELKKYVKAEQFVTTVTDKSGQPKEVLRALKGRGSFSDAIEEALTHSPDAKDLFKGADIKKKDVEDIAQRTQLESAGSEGLQKYLVLLANKKSPEKHLILYLKQQIPSAAERVGLIPKDERAPGKRSSQDMHDLSRPPSYFNSWCEWNGSSFRLSIKEPWTETLDAADVNTFEDLKHMARIWGTVAGSVHRQGEEAVARVKSRLTPELARLLRERGITYTRKAVEDARQFNADPRVRAQTAKAEAGLRELSARSR